MPLTVARKQPSGLDKIKNWFVGLTFACRFLEQFNLVPRSGYKVMNNNYCDWSTDWSLHNQFHEVFQVYLFFSAHKQLVLTN